MPWMIRKKGTEWCVYHKGADGNPTGKTKGCHSTEVKAKAQMRALYHFVKEGAVEEEFSYNGRPCVIASLVGPVRVLETEETDGDAKVGLGWQGVVLIDGVISQGGTGRYYSEDFNNRCMEATNLFMSAEGIVTIYSRHGKVVGESGKAMYPTGLPVGKVTKPLWREGKEIWYEARITPTAEGKDVALLIEQKVLVGTSLRAVRYRSRKRKINGVTVEEMLDAVILGIDLCDQAGIAGAGIRKVLEEEPQWEVEEEMDYKALTLEELKTNCQPLLDEYAATGLAEKDTTIAELADQLAVNKGEHDAAAVALEEAQGKLKMLALYEASTTGLSKLIVDRLVTAGVSTPEEIAEKLPAVKAEALQALLAESAVPGEADSAKGATHIVQEEEGEKPKRVLTERQKTILSYVM